MRFLYAKLSGYIGIYNGLGLKEIEIDFTKSQNKICVITGPNGCGKSTLLNALNILPDGNENFVSSLPASKTLRIFDEGTIYDIFINHPLDGRGSRAVTKVSIAKNGIELNPNGNVSSYKDIIFNEFDLDSNFITLTHLSSNDRGLADKKPAERKKFLASITSSLDTYNGIYKNLNKKGNVYKSYINGLTGKISNIGDEANLRSTYSSLSKRQESISKDIEDLKAKKIQQQTIANINNLNGELQTKYNQLEQDITNLENQYALSKTDFDRYCNINKIEAKDLVSLEAKKNEQENIKQEYERSLETGRSNLSIIINDIKNINENIEKDSAHIEKLKQEVSEDIEDKLNQAKAELDRINKDFSEVGITDPSEITKDSIDQIISIVTDFVSMIDYIYENLEESKFKDFADVMSSGETLLSIIDKNTNLRESLKTEVHQIEDFIRELSEELSVILESEARPSKCKIDTCPFLSSSIYILNKYSKKSIKECKTYISKLIKDNSDKVQHLYKNIQSCNEYGELLQIYLPMSTNLDRVRALIELNHAIFNKIGMITPLLDFDAVFRRISVGDRFNEFRDIRSLTYISNDIIEYKSISVIYNNLYSEYKANQSNLRSLKEYSDDLEKLNEVLNQKYGEREAQSKDIQFVQGVIDKSNNTITILSTCISKFNNMENLNNKIVELKSEYQKIQKQFEGSAGIIQIIHELDLQIEKLNTELEPIAGEMKDIESRILLLDNYKKEYAEYSNKYNEINILKKYSSPTAGGIQTFFMSLYMGKTLELANQLLGMIFQGQYQLLDYVITPDEFRMPFIGSGLAVDDITSGSTSQVCIMGMIINLSLLNQASTRFNITRLDEIDGGLDFSNRAVFMQILQRVIDILGIEQLFIISHNMESYNGGTDAIQLAPIEGMDDNANGSNVIYHY